MATRVGNLVSKLADADSRKLARWVADRLRHVGHVVFWHASRLRMLAHDAAGLPGKLPPGSLSPSCTAEATTDDRFYLRQLRLLGPIFKLFWGSGHLKICVVGYPLARRLFNQHRGALHPVSPDVTALVPAEYLRSMNPAIHPHYRRLFKTAFRDDLVTALEPELRGIIRWELAALADGRPNDVPPAERLYATLQRISTRTLLRLIFGLKPDSELVPILEDAYHRMGPHGYLVAVGPEQKAAFPAIRALVLQMLQSLRQRDTAVVADSLLKRLVQSGPESAIDETVIGNAIYMVERGRHDLRDLLRWIVKYLSDNPSITAELRDAGMEPGCDSPLAEACVLETLRLDQAENLNRKVLKSFSFAGFHVPKGSWVSILMRETHRDPEVFAEPDCFRPRRFLQQEYSADEYAPFGIDEHQCIGASLVRRTGTIFVEELVRGYTWSVISDGPRRYGTFHWQPSPSFAIDIRRDP